MTKDELILKRDSEIAELKEKVAELEEIIYEYEENDMGILVSETEQIALKVIHQQLDELAKISEVAKLDKDEAKNFDTFVKDLVAIRGKLPTPKTKEVEKIEGDIRDNLELLYKGNE